jgi:hypothetical protein
MADARGSSKILKSANFGWLCTVVLFDLVVMCIVVMPGVIETATASKIAVARGVCSALLPVVPLMLVNSLPPILKARLVFWRWRYPNPGSRAFTVYIHEDDRINIDKLRKHVGAFPDEPKEQNALWYALYQRVQNEVGVLEAHKTFLLHRDIASISLLLLIFAAALMLALGFSGSEIGKAAIIFAVQYLLAAMSARSSGERFVCTVLALHSVRKIANASKAQG